MNSTHDEVLKGTIEIRIADSVRDGRGPDGLTPHERRRRAKRTRCFWRAYCLIDGERVAVPSMIARHQIHNGHDTVMCTRTSGTEHVRLVVPLTRRGEIRQAARRALRTRGWR